MKRLSPLDERGERAQSGALIGVVLGVIVLFAFVGAAIFIASRSSDSDANTDVYVSIGDSVAAGAGASDPTATGYVALLAARHEINLFNVAVGGATTQDVLDEQLARTLAPIQAARARFVTISAGGNDLAGLIPNPACVEDPLPDACPLDDQLSGVRTRLGDILRYIRDANQQVPIVILAYPNFFSGTGHGFEEPAGRVLPRLNDVIREVASQYERVAVAETAAAFEGNGDELTGLLDPVSDPHPNDAGHRVIADAFDEALDSID